jgi:hypothetical protein
MWEGGGERGGGFPHQEEEGGDGGNRSGFVTTRQGRERVKPPTRTCDRLVPFNSDPGTCLIVIIRKNSCNPPEMGMHQMRDEDEKVR